MSFVATEYQRLNPIGIETCRPQLQEMNHDTTLEQHQITSVTMRNEASIEIPERVTDQRLKGYFSQCYSSVVRFVPGIGWHMWDGKRWCTDMPGGLHPLIDHMQRHLRNEASNIVDESQRIARRKALIGLESHIRQKTIIAACEHVPDLISGANRLDSDPMLLNCQNGTIDLTTGSLKMHSSKDLITRIINVEFNPGESCPVFLKFLSWAMCYDMELVSYIQRFIGYCLTGKTSEQILNFWYGTGGNGKTTLINVIQWLLCDYATTADTSLIMKSHNGGSDNNKLTMLAGLRGSRFGCG